MVQAKPARPVDRLFITINKREPAPTKYELAEAVYVLTESIRYTAEKREDFESPETQGLLRSLKALASDAESKALPNGENAVVEQPDTVWQKTIWLAKLMLKNIGKVGDKHSAQEINADAFKIAKILCDYADGSYNKLNCSRDESTGQLKIELLRDGVIEEIGVLDFRKSRAEWRVVFRGGNGKLDKRISAVLSQ
ncbi:MAG: hypothetical protein Q7T16_04640 [Candidatus Burarchaeum sp.]|nr:hypothetical protein [Candidatus Burarchaeum sp.]MDO8339916.1 hypothetical protein [Candidatus Burarchaeum sp.]